MDYKWRPQDNTVAPQLSFDVSRTMMMATGGMKLLVEIKTSGDHDARKGDKRGNEQ